MEPDRKGWICSKCDASVGPDVATCPVCTGAPASVPLTHPAVEPVIPIHVCYASTSSGACDTCGRSVPTLEVGQPTFRVVPPGMITKTGPRYVAPIFTTKTVSPPEFTVSLMGRSCDHLGACDCYGRLHEGWFPVSISGLTLKQGATLCAP